MAGAEVVFVFASTHAAMAGESTLENSPIPVRVMAKPDQMGAGCGICLRVPETAHQEAQRLLEENGAPPESVFLARRGPNGMEYQKCGN